MRVSREIENVFVPVLNNRRSSAILELSVAHKVGFSSFSVRSCFTMVTMKFLLNKITK